MSLEGFSSSSAENHETHAYTGIDRIFELNPQLQAVGSKEQYACYLDTLFPATKVREIVYHGSGKPIEKFDKSKVKNPTGGFFFTENRENARIVGESRQSLFGKSKFTLYAALLDIQDPFDHAGRLNRLELINKPYKNNDSLILRDIEDTVPEKITEYVVFEPEQIHILGSSDDIEGFKKFIAEQ